MIKLFDRVKLKDGDAEVGITKEDVGVVVDIAYEKNGETVYSIEFIDKEGATNMAALFKYYQEEKIIKID